MADGFGFLAGAMGLVLLFSLPYILLLVAIWRIGTGTQQTAVALLKVAKAQSQMAEELRGLDRIADATYQQSEGEQRARMPPEPKEPAVVVPEEPRVAVTARVAEVSRALMEEPFPVAAPVRPAAERKRLDPWTIIAVIAASILAVLLVWLFTIL